MAGKIMPDSFRKKWRISSASFINTRWINSEDGMDKSLPNWLDNRKSSIFLQEILMEG
jgi:hypothetical protein